MLANRLRRWPNIRPTLGQYIVFAVVTAHCLSGAVNLDNVEAGLYLQWLQMIAASSLHTLYVIFSRSLSSKVTVI